MSPAVAEVTSTPAALLHHSPLLDPQQASKELAMQIGEDEQEYEILPTEQEQQPVVLPEHEPPRQPEDTPA
jgi:hypothetical protein